MSAVIDEVTVQAECLDADAAVRHLSTDLLAGVTVVAVGRETVEIRGPQESVHLTLTDLAFVAQTSIQQARLAVAAAKKDNPVLTARAALRRAAGKLAAVQREFADADAALRSACASTAADRNMDYLDNRVVALHDTGVE